MPLRNVHRESLVGSFAEFDDVLDVPVLPGRTVCRGVAMDDGDADCFELREFRMRRQYLFARGHQRRCSGVARSFVRDGKLGVTNRYAESNRAARDLNRIRWVVGGACDGLGDCLEIRYCDLAAVDALRSRTA